MLLTKYGYATFQAPEGLYITVLRFEDSATKAFFQANVKTPEARASFCSFMDSITDELAEGYFPREKKKK